MKRSLLEILACPLCGFNLVLRKELDWGDEIEAGWLVCLLCAASFPIRDGVPCLLPDQQDANRTRQAFTEQWQLKMAGRFEKSTIYGQDPRQRAEFLLENGIFFGLEPGDWILDAGCGSGDLTYALAAQYPQARVVGLDFCDTLYTAAQRARAYPNLSFVNGDLLAPPFKRSSFTGLYSWGVLHHTANTGLAFQITASLVAWDGTLVVWIYPDASESPWLIRILYLFRDRIFGGRGHLLPGKLRFRLVQVVSLFFSPVFAIALGLDGRTLARRLGRQRLGELRKSFEIVNWKAGDFYRLMIFLIFDSLTPEYQFRHSQAEVQHWFVENGFVGIQTYDAIPGYYWGKRSSDGRGDIQT
jgi:uncharacterized protein YbaR (Trm112 family)